MENASKALIMAASMLIALMIIGALILMFNNIHNYKSSGEQNEREAQVIEFNKQYETYNRKNVRGSDLYSLLNKVIDYNRRKSTEGGKLDTQKTDQGQYLAYEPMTIKYDLKGNEKKLTYDDTNRIFTTGFATFELNDKTVNKLDVQINGKLESGTTYATKEYMQVLAGEISAIYEANTDKNKLSAVELWNRCVKATYKVKPDGTNREKIDNYSTITNNGTIKDAIYTYYEYMQFKRAHFDCTNVEYNNKTGRITKMEFEFNGKFN